MVICLRIIKVGININNEFMWFIKDYNYDGDEKLSCRGKTHY